MEAMGRGNTGIRLRLAEGPEAFMIDMGPRRAHLVTERTAILQGASS